MTTGAECPCLNCSVEEGDPIKIDFRVVTHHSRRQMGSALAKSVRGILLEDDGTLGEYENHRRAWADFGLTSATHVCVLQDDAIPIPGFIDTIHEAIASRPDDLVSLYVGTGRPGPDDALQRAQANADRYGGAWLEDINLMWGVGVVMPAERAHQFSQWTPPALDYYDNRLGNWWYRVTGRKAQYTWPSLVDHADEVSLVSTTDQPERKAFRVGAARNYRTLSFPLFLR